MKTNTIVPCIWLDDQAEEAATFYTKSFAGGRVVATSHYPASSDNPAGKPRGSVMTIEIEIAGQRFTLLNGGPMFVINPSISFFAFVGTVAEVDGIFASLADGGQVLMPIDKYPWSERFGWVKDRFGVSWQVMVDARGANGTTIAPCLMFTGASHGRAEEALRLYVDTFSEGRILSLDRYAAPEGPEGTIKLGRAVLAGHEFTAMDSDFDHGFTFNEGLSLQVMCKDQGEIDHHWTRLSEGGSPGPCGWLKDRFGVSWQIVPANIADWMNSKDTAARDRAFAAMMGMTKIDVAAIDSAFRGM
jgi:predicted 3-demethylubiquinone-9 3-methyltransferase (glyoxalase superfamily)